MKSCPHGVIIPTCKIIVSFMTMCLLAAAVAYAQPDSTQKVLILNSYHKGFKWTDDQVSAAEKVLSEGHKHIELFVEYMDTKRLYSEEYLGHLFNIYRLKYKNVHLDTIIATDDNALWFVLQHHKELFGEAPVSFCGINDYKKSFLKGKQQFTGLVEVLDIKPTIDLALKLHPETRRIIVVVDSTPTGLGQKRDIAAVARHYNNLQFEYIEGKENSHAQLFEKLGSLSRDSIVLLTVWLRDKNNVYLSPDKGGRLISSRSTVPVYGIIDMYHGCGIVGGKLLNSRTHGRVAAEIALRIINGETPANIPAIFKSTNPYMFDYKELERWHIIPSELPEGSIIINKPISFYRENKRLIWIVIGIFSSLILIVLMLTNNILHRKKTEEALRKSEKRHRTILRTAMEGFWFLDTKGRLLEANEAYCRMSGYNEDELRNMSIVDLEASETPEEINANIEKIILQGKTRFERKHRRKDGTLFDVEISIQYQPEMGGRFFCFVRDITQRKRAFEEIKKANETMKLAADSARFGIWYLDIKENRLEWDDWMFRLYGMDRDHFSGVYEAWQAGVHPDDLERSSKEVEIALTGKKPFDTEFRIIRPDGAVRHLKAHAVVSRDKQGNPIHMTGINYDITEEKELKEQIQQTQKMESIGNLAGGIAHDFNNLLFPIIGMSELLMEDLATDGPDWKKAEEILKAAQRGSELVKQILAFSRQSEHKKIPTRVQQVLKEVLNLSRSTIPSIIEIDHSIQPDCGLIMADPTKIHQVAMNIITNAYHAVEAKGGKITVKLEEMPLATSGFLDTDLGPGNYAVLSISDTGPGMSESVIPKIFDPYFTTKEKGKGTGLGLAVVYGIIKDHRGAITVKSEIGSGTTFTVYLPLMEKPGDVQSIEPIEACKGGDERILVVDDEETVANLEEKVLERLGYQVTKCIKSRDALALFQSNPGSYDLILSDMTMPDLTGDQLAIKIKSIRPDIPVIICTGFSEKIDAKKAKKIGIDGFLTKPVLRSELAKKIRTVLEDTKGEFHA